MSSEKGWSDERFDGAVAQEFNLAMSRLYGKDLYSWTRNFLLKNHAKESITEEEMASLTGISQNTVSR